MLVSRIVIVLIVFSCVVAPVLQIVALGLKPAQFEVFFPNLWRYGLKTFLLVLSTVSIAFLSGVVPAFFVSRYAFLGRNLFRFSLLLPLALPGYLLAYVYADFFEYAGPVQSMIREVFSFRSPSEYPFFDVRSLPVASILLGIGFSPYVYVFSLASFDQHAGNAYETARVLGLGPVRSFLQVVLPISRPAWVAGLLLVAMETIADFGAVQHLAVNTLTLGIFTTWLELGDLVTAARLALFAGGVILVIAALEGRLRGARGYSSALSPKPHLGIGVSGSLSLVMCAVCALPLLVGFVLPVTILLSFALQSLEQFTHPDFLSALFYSVKLSGIATVVGTGVALSFALLVPHHRYFKGIIQMAFVGYMLPGTIFALGLMSFLIPLSNDFLDAGLIQTGLLGGMFGLLYGYIARFFALSHGVIRAGIETIPPSIDDAGSLYGSRPWVVWWRVKLPILRGHLVCAGLVFFVETLKELPMSLIMRPAGTETLSTYLYHYAGDENLALAAPGALVIVFMGTLAVLMLAHFRRRRMF